MVIFLYNLYILVWLQHDCLANAVFALDPSHGIIKRLWYFQEGQIENEWRENKKQNMNKF